MRCCFRGRDVCGIELLLWMARLGGQTERGIGSSRVFVGSGCSCILRIGV